MMTLTRRYRFSASHRLHSPALTDEQNRTVYGKCNNPYGHGHDYVLDVTVRGPLDPPTGRIVDLDTLDGIVKQQVLDRFDHRNLNAEIDSFAGVPPTTEVVAGEIARRLRSAWASRFGATCVELAKIRIWETPRNIFEVTL